MVFESEYNLEDVPATPVASDKIDGTFRSSTIGEFYSRYLRWPTARKCWIWGLRSCLSEP
jgi:hypothetical protein